MSERDEGDAAFSTALAALASPVRLRILRELRAPRAIGDIEVAGERADGGRVVARATVREHVERLVQAGVVSRRAAGDASHGEAQAFVINHASIFAIAEDVRALARLQPLVENAALPTAPLGPHAPRPIEGPRLVVVRGLEEGVSFSLKPERERASWTVGRRRGADVRLDFDPFVSSENAVIAWEDGKHRIRDVERSRNGTSVNFQRLAHDAARELRHGDVVGVGRSYLVFWNDRS